MTSTRHVHPAPARGASRPRVIVVGGGHAGIEAALAGARLGAEVVLVSFRLDKVGEMSCNPAIGGLGKGQIVREIDALGGAMGRIADATGIQFRMLGTAKGAAVHGPRCQSDRHRYREAATAEVSAAAGVELIQGAATGLIVKESGAGPAVHGVVLEDGRRLEAAATVLTTGTFLRAIMHTAEEQAAGGRLGEGSAEGLSLETERLGLVLGRLKTGTPPRLAADGIDWSRLEAQGGDARPSPFSFGTDRTRFPELPQIDCHLTATNARTHEIIRDNVHRAPMYAGRIRGVGPRYCPSVEDKVMRFAERERHPIYLEPEGLDTDVVYVNGVSTSLPAEVQEAFMRTIDGLERARFLRHGYAIEYDFVQPFQLSDTLAVRRCPGLFLAGQINGTSGYEEAAGQGLIAGANAALWADDREPFVLRRDEAYVGVMVDDLIVSNPTEPYRMFTSRAEFRLLLRQDNADRRLVRRACEVGLQERAALERLEHKEGRLEEARGLLESLRGEGGRTLLELLRRPEVGLARLAHTHPELAALELDAELSEALEVDVKYAGYVTRQRTEVERMRRRDAVEIPPDLDYALISGLAGEAREKLQNLRPRTLGAATRIAGVRPPDVALLSIQIERHLRCPGVARPS
jgi:tRNA uridine 5-carboxymethylaminomethyl modification enzyme